MTSDDEPVFDLRNNPIFHEIRKGVYRAGYQRPSIRLIRRPGVTYCRMTVLDKEGKIPTVSVCLDVAEEGFDFLTVEDRVRFELARKFHAEIADTADGIYYSETGN